jgi:hypothetical protein
VQTRPNKRYGYLIIEKSIMMSQSGGFILQTLYSDNHRTSRCAMKTVYLVISVFASYDFVVGALTAFEQEILDVSNV